LGSSAGVTVAIIGGLCRTFDPTTNSRTINCLSQLAHLAAQKKIGSNFDISTAVYGTHLYKNILPNLVYNIIGSN
jgi:phosphomevalonate kinase